MKLIAPIDREGDTELRNLARRRGTTAKLLGQLAVRQLLTTAQTGMFPALPMLDPEIRDVVPVWLGEADKAALDDLAEARGTTPEVLASLAIRHLLAQTRRGALPMLKPHEPPEPDGDSWEDSGALLNFSKARLILNRLQFIAEWGMTEEQQASLRELEKLHTVSPD